jgi:hypothetical protein
MCGRQILDAMRVAGKVRPQAYSLYAEDRTRGPATTQRAKIWRPV